MDPERLHTAACGWHHGGRAGEPVPISRCV